MGLSNLYLAYNYLEQERGLLMWGLMRELLLSYWKQQIDSNLEQRF